MAGFADVTRRALQPSVLALDPAFASALYERDLLRTRQQRTTARDRATSEQRHADDARRRALHSGAFGYGFLAPGAERDVRWNPRPTPVEHPQQYLLDAIAEEQARAAYQQAAPLLRSLDRVTRA